PDTQYPALTQSLVGPGYAIERFLGRTKPEASSLFTGIRVLHCNLNTEVACGRKGVLSWIYQGETLALAVHLQLTIVHLNLARADYKLPLLAIQVETVEIIKK